jgi:hypothetical protein
MNGPRVHSEDLTSVAIDGARISVFTATAIVEADADLPPDRKAMMLRGMAAAAACLDQVREILPVITTSVHIVRPDEL